MDKLCEAAIILQDNHDARDSNMLHCNLTDILTLQSRSEVASDDVAFTMQRLLQRYNLEINSETEQGSFTKAVTHSLQYAYPEMSKEFQSFLTSLGIDFDDNLATSQLKRILENKVLDRESEKKDSRC